MLYCRASFGSLPVPKVFSLSEDMASLTKQQLSSMPCQRTGIMASFISFEQFEGLVIMSLSPPFSPPFFPFLPSFPPFPSTLLLSPHSLPLPLLHLLITSPFSHYLLLSSSCSILSPPLLSVSILSLLTLFPLPSFLSLPCLHPLGTLMT